MKFISSAIKVFPKDQSAMIVYGHRHSDCLEQIWKMNIDRHKNNDIQGFIVIDESTNNEIFVDRFQGAQIAKSLGYTLEYENCLYSEDIWPE